MSDLVERLRQGIGIDDLPESEAVMDSAAEEIERLQQLCNARQEHLNEGGRLISELSDKLEKSRSELARANMALEEIRDHWANQYDHPRKDNEMYRGSYGIGVTDGHRACAIIARRGLGEESPS